MKNLETTKIEKGMKALDQAYKYFFAAKKEAKAKNQWGVVGSLAYMAESTEDILLHGKSLLENLAADARRNLKLYRASDGKLVSVPEE